MDLYKINDFDNQVMQELWVKSYILFWEMPNTTKTNFTKNKNYTDTTVFSTKSLILFFLTVKIILEVNALHFIVDFVIPFLVGNSITVLFFNKIYLQKYLYYKISTKIKRSRSFFIF